MRQQSDRWSLLPHRNDDPPERKLAIEIVERLLPARWHANLPWPHDRFPLTMSFIVRVAEQLGVKLSQRRAYRVRREALEVLEFSSYYSPDHALDEHRGYDLYQLREDLVLARSSEKKAQADVRENLLSARERCQVLMREIFGGRDPP